MTGGLNNFDHAGAAEKIHLRAGNI